MNVKKLTDVDVRGKRVFIRSDLNVPQDDAGNITEDTRIRASIPSIKYCLDNGAAVMVTSHLGRPTEGEVKADDTLMPVAVRLGQLLNKPVRLIQNWVDGGFEVKPGEVVLLENCRCNKGEKKDNEELAQKMAKLCDVYVNDAFGTAHRAEATTHGIARFAPVACAGMLMGGEIDALAKAIENPARPLVAIVGGAKVSSKLVILKSLAEKVDQLIVGGGIAGLWLQARLRQLGYASLLVENASLGGGQSVKSQGIIHGGAKYALHGALTTTVATAGVQSGSKVRWHAEGAGKDIVTTFGLWHESHCEVIHLIAQLGLVADVLEGDRQRHVADAEFADAEAAGIGGG